MRVVHFSTSDSGGGAFRAAYRLHTGLRRLGHDSQMLVLRKGTSDPNVHAVRPRQDLVGRMMWRWRGRRIHRDFDRYRPTIPPGTEPFSDDRSEFMRSIVGPLPQCDVINLHWVGGFVDWIDFFRRAPTGVPIVWRLA